MDDPACPRQLGPCDFISHLEHKFVVPVSHEDNPEDGLYEVLTDTADCEHDEGNVVRPRDAHV
eukprot:CAMPEP_0185797752 /NCGR_PEP_ID=MMETSP1174-20130828/161783_1 /TAXON_ID=35687 /ORGANISM="Dictyocha speculum, Strain CCMP1381" /LENGTH=62 /DNA_ID=CAMNT_0028493203 /DNA_START=950 /DNA_END=1138 /DNA_ORIENTATION=+